MIVRLMGMLGGFGLSVLLGRQLGVEGFGTIELANRIALFIFIFGNFGLPDIILREIAIAYRQNDYQRINNSLYTSIKFSGIVSAIIISITILAAPYMATTIFKQPDLALPLQIISGATLFLTLSKSYTSGINALGRVWQSTLGDQTLSIVLVFFIALVISSFSQLTILAVAIAYFIARVGVFIFMKYYWNRIYIPGPSVFTGKTKFQKQLLKPSLRVLLSSTSSMVSTGASSIVLGIMATVKDVGLYNTASKIALLTIIFLQITNAALAPKIAALYHEGRKKQLSILLTKVTSVLLLISIATFGLIYIYGYEILALFGTEFKEAYLYLIIITLGQMVNIAAGAVNTILVMTNNEKTLSNISFVFMMLTLLINPLFIYAYGGIGASIATAIIIAGENITRAFYVRKRTGIIINPFFRW